MIGSSPPPARPGELPQFIDKAGCEAWLSRQPLSNTAQMQTTLVSILADLNTRPIQARERYRILETLRPTVTEVDAASSKRFEYRPLPMSATEHSAFLSSCSLWQEMASGYLHCLQDCLDQPPELAELAAKAGHRAISAMRLEQLSRYRGRATIPGRWWQDLHALLLLAERLGIEQATVADRLLKETRESTISGHYAMAVLLHLCRPETLSRKQLAALLRWLGRWRELAALRSTQPAGDACALPIDLAASTPRHLPPVHGNVRQEKLRWLQVDSVLGKLRGRISSLQAGQSPEALKLGNELPAAECISLLQHLAACLRTPALPLAEEDRIAACGQARAEAAREVEVLASVDDIYQLSGGIPLNAKATPSASSNLREREQIAVFGRILKPEATSEATRVRGEKWQLLDAGEPGACLEYLWRPGSPAGSPVAPFRIAHRSLLGILDASGLRLAIVHGLLQHEDGSLQASLHLLPGGRPRGLVAIVTTGNEKFPQNTRLPAVFLPAGATDGTQASVFVLAGSRGALTPGMRLEVPDLPGGLMLSLDKAPEHGANFERWYCA